MYFLYIVCEVFVKGGSCCQIQRPLYALSEGQLNYYITARPVCQHPKITFVYLHNFSTFHEFLICNFHIFYHIQTFSKHILFIFAKDIIRNFNTNGADQYDIL